MSAMPDLLLRTYTDHRFVQARIVSLAEAAVVIATLPDGWHSHVRNPNGSKISQQTFLELATAVVAFNRAREERASSPPPSEGHICHEDSPDPGRVTPDTSK